MASRLVKLALVGSALLSIGVAANMFFMQTAKRQQVAGQKQAQAAAKRELAEATRRPSVEPPRIGQVDGRAIPDTRATAAPAKPNEPDTVTGETIRAIQRELMARGYETGGQDGVTGLVTRAAILAFEHDHGLALSAEPTDDLLRAIVLGAPPVPARDGRCRQTPACGPSRAHRAAIARGDRLFCRFGRRTGRRRPGAGDPRV
jgi:Putative peptidoglycan binding domain